MATFDPNNPYQQEVLGLDRQRQLSQMLLQQGMQQPQGQMVSGRFVAPAITERLANLLSVYGGQKGLADVEKKQLELAQKIRNQEAQDINKFFQYQYGSPAQSMEMAGPYGVGVGQDGANVPMPTMDMPEVQRNPQMAYQIAAQSQSPVLRQQLADMLKGRTVKEGETYYRYNPIKGVEEPVLQGGVTLPTDLKSVAIRLGLPLDSSKWTDQQRQLADAAVKEEKRLTGTNLTVNTGQKGFDNTLKLRGDFRSEPVYKGFQEVESAFGQINKGLDAKSPAGDLAAATKFMKLLDPTSVVRESELAMAMQASGALDRLYNLANNIYTGQKLTPTQREDFRTLAKDFYSTSYDQYSTKREEYVGIAKRNELNIEDVVGKEPKAPAVAQPPVYAVNQSTGERIQSTDGGKTWKPAPKAK